MVTRILLVDDHPMVLDGLRMQLKGEPGMVIVGEACTGMEAVGKAGELKPDLVILDVVLPDISGMEVTRRITAKRRTRVLAVSGYDKLQTIREMFVAGAHGFISKTADRATMIRAIETVMACRKYVPDDIAARFGREDVEGAKERLTDRLADREREVLVHIANGIVTQEIAHRMAVSVSTVKTYRQRIAEKLGTDNTVMLVKIAAREALVGLDGAGGEKSK